MSDQKIKTAADKAPLGLVPARALIGPARVFQYGAKKYAAGNFYQATLDDGAGARYVSAALRHLSEMQLPNGLHTPESLATLDPESGLPHIDHVLCGLMMLRSIMVKSGALTDDPGLGKEPPTLVNVIDAAAARFDGRPLSRASIAARAELDARDRDYVNLTGDRLRDPSRPLEVLAKEVDAEFPKCRLCGKDRGARTYWCDECVDKADGDELSNALAGRPVGSPVPPTIIHEPKHDLRTCQTPECVEVRTTTLGPIEPAKKPTQADLDSTAEEYRVAFWPQVQGPSDFHDPTEGVR